MMKILSSVIASLFVSSVAHATMTEYAAPLDDSIWVLSNSSPIECRMDHIIPAYGVASFVSSASKQINLDFYLDMYRPQAQTQSVSLRSVPPRWKPGKAVNSMAELTFFQQFDGYVNDQNAWRMLHELNGGNFPTFYYDDWYGQNSATAVSISAVNFRPQYQDFVQCLNRLLPYSFEDIAFTVLSYKSNSDELTTRSQQRLRLIGEYVKHDPEINLVLLDAYTDSYGGRWTNQTLSEKRANAVKSFFVQNGLAEHNIEVSGYGEKRHVATNKNHLGRERNRRVVISLGKDLL